MPSVDDVRRWLVGEVVEGLPYRALPGRSRLDGARCYYANQGKIDRCKGPLQRVVPMTHFGDEPLAYIMCATHAEDYIDHWAEQHAEANADVL